MEQDRTAPRRLSIFLAVLMLANLGCAPPGKGARAERGYQQAARIIRALDACQKAVGRYPSTLSELVPNYLQATDLILKAASNSVYEFQYALENGGYTLTFRYFGPGINDCTYRSATKAWVCHGRY